ncbi:MAG: glycosyltransferase [Bacteroidales bacterium]|nr:glycosyltransferase [Bacteroidales bacterium]
MRILVAGSFRYEIYTKAFYEAFRRLGHDVRKLDTEAFVHEGGAVADILEKVKHHWLVGPSIVAADRALKKTVREFRPDLVFLYHCYFFTPAAIKAVSRETTVFSYENDDPFERRSDKHNPSFYIAAARWCKMNYVFRRKNVEDFARLGIDNVKVLLPYYTETRNFPMACEKDIPLAFVGHGEDDGRDAMIKELLDAGLPFSLYGDEYSWSKSPLWPQLKSCYHGPANGDVYNAVLNRVKVALVFFSKKNNDTYTRRSFELPVTKTVMLSEYTADMDEFWPENECCVYFRNTEELVQKAKWLLEHDEEQKRIAGNAFNRLKVLGGSETDRVREVLADYDLIARGKNPLS